MKYRVIFDDFKTFEKDGYPDKFEKCLYVTKDGRVSTGEWIQNFEDFEEKTFKNYFSGGAEIAFEEDIEAWTPVANKKPQNIDERFVAKDGMSTDDYLSMLVDALQEAISVQDQFSAALKELEDENTFLTNVIIENHLASKVVEKRKQLEQAKEVFSNDEDDSFDENLSFTERIERAKKKGN